MGILHTQVCKVSFSFISKEEKQKNSNKVRNGMLSETCLFCLLKKMPNLLSAIMFSIANPMSDRTSFQFKSFKG